MRPCQRLSVCTVICVWLFGDVVVFVEVLCQIFFLRMSSTDKVKTTHLFNRVYTYFLLQSQGAHDKMLVKRIQILGSFEDFLLELIVV
jgi:hypothetical protein